jgi:hypothetical protein
MEDNLISQDKNFAIDIIINIVLGIVIGIVFGYIIFKRKLYKGPNSGKITKETYEDSNGKYIWEPVITICPLGTIHTPH